MGILQSLFGSSDMKVDPDGDADCDHEWNVENITLFRRREGTMNLLHIDDKGTHIVEVEMEGKKCTKCDAYENRTIEERKKYFSFEETEVIE